MSSNAGAPCWVTGCARAGAYGWRGFALGCAPATSGRFRRKWAPISPWVLDFCAVSGGSRSLSAPPTWGNAGVLRCFGLVRPAKPPRSLRAISVLEFALLPQLAPMNSRQLLPFDPRGLGPADEPRIVVGHLKREAGACGVEAVLALDGQRQFGLVAGQAQR